MCVHISFHWKRKLYFICQNHSKLNVHLLLLFLLEYPIKFFHSQIQNCICQDASSSYLVVIEMCRKILESIQKNSKECLNTLKHTLFVIFVEVTTWVVAVIIIIIIFTFVHVLLFKHVLSVICCCAVCSKNIALQNAKKEVVGCFVSIGALDNFTCMVHSVIRLLNLFCEVIICSLRTIHA